MVTQTMEATVRTLQVEFIVIDAISTYNGIMGRGWIREIEGVDSTLYQVTRCDKATAQ